MSKYLKGQLKKEHVSAISNVAKKLRLEEDHVEHVTKHFFKELRQFLKNNRHNDEVTFVIEHFFKLQPSRTQIRRKWAEGKIIMDEIIKQDEEISYIKRS